jgi:hypothetical protein
LRSGWKVWRFIWLSGPPFRRIFWSTFTPIPVPSSFR